MTELSRELSHSLFYYGRGNSRFMRSSFDRWIDVSVRKMLLSGALATVLIKIAFYDVPLGAQSAHRARPLMALDIGLVTRGK